MSYRHHLSSIYVGAFNTREEVEILLDRHICELNSWCSGLLRKSLVRNGITAHKDRKKVRFFDMTRQEFNRVRGKNCSTMLALKCGNGWHPVGVIGTGDLNRLYDTVYLPAISAGIGKQADDALLAEFVELIGPAESRSTKIGHLISVNDDNNHRRSHLQE